MRSSSLFALRYAKKTYFFLFRLGKLETKTAYRRLSLYNRLACLRRSSSAKVI